MKNRVAPKSILLVLACTAFLCLPMACGKKQTKPFVSPSVPLPAQIEVAFKRNPFDTNSFLRPYEPAQLYLGGPGIQNHPSNERIWLDADSRMDGLPIPEAMIQYLRFGHVGFLGQTNAMVGPEFQPWSLLPRKTGSTTFDLVLHTEREKWICPPLVLTLSASEDEARMIAEFEASGASQFLNHKIGARRTSESAAPALPYTAVADFLQKYPDSYITEAIKQRIACLYLTDINSCGPYSDGPLLQEDRQALATISGRINPHFVERATQQLKNYEKFQASSKLPEQINTQIDTIQEWLRVATAAGAEKVETK